MVPRLASTVLSAVCCIGGFLLAYFMARLDRRIQENGRA